MRFLGGSLVAGSVCNKVSRSYGLGKATHTPARPSVVRRPSSLGQTKSTAQPGNVCGCARRRRDSVLDEGGPGLSHGRRVGVEKAKKKNAVMSEGWNLVFQVPQ